MPKNKVDIEHTAKLANLTISAEVKNQLTKEFNETLAYVDQIQEIDTSEVGETNQVTGMTNVFREDLIDSKHCLTQEQALKNARRKYKGYFVVDAVLNE